MEFLGLMVRAVLKFLRNRETFSKVTIILHPHQQCMKVPCFCKDLLLSVFLVFAILMISHPSFDFPIDEMMFYIKKMYICSQSSTLFFFCV